MPQAPSSTIFPPLPQGFNEPFWYASLQSFWLYYRVDPDALTSVLPKLADGDGLELALFDFDGQQAGLVSLDLQRYTGHGPSYLETTDEIEFNVYVYPESRLPDVPVVAWRDYLLGVEQTKTIGGYRLHVPCDNQIAVLAGQELYGEPKFLAVFDYTVPSLNSPTPSNAWSYSVYQDLGDPPDPSKPHTPIQGPLIYTLDCKLDGVPSVPGSASPLIEYGTVKSADGSLHAIANHWDFYGPFATYFRDDTGPAWGATITLGQVRDPSGTLDDVKSLIGDSQPLAAQVFTSAPVSAESRGWFPVPTS
jgi:hypothetical protein